jgi:hypothetical protein
MALCVVMANQTLGGAALFHTILDRYREGCSIHIVVPATEPDHHHGPADGASGEDRALRQLNTAVDRLSAEGVTATGSVGDADPMTAIRDVLASHSATEVIISTLPHHVSRWFHMDLPHRIAREFKIEVEVIEATTESFDEDTSVHDVILPADAKRFVTEDGRYRPRSPTRFWS